MRTKVWGFGLVALFGGCAPDYNLEDNKPGRGENNPVELETPVRVDRIVQVTTPAADVLWVIDNSCSMSEEQESLVDNFPAFINYFVDSGLDWHVGVVSTDMDKPDHRGKLRSAAGYRYLDDAVPDPVDMFTAMAEMGTSGSYEEKGRAAAYSALELLKNGPNAGFYRDEASLSVIVISDEDDQSGNNPSLNEFIQWLSNLKVSLDEVSFSAIVTPPNNCYTGVEPGLQYLKVVDAVGGIKWSICDNNWVQLLDELGMQAAGLRREFFLSELPVPGSIVVRVVEGENTQVYDEGLEGEEKTFTYEQARNSIRFNNAFVPEPLAAVEIDYRVLSAEQEDGVGTE